MLVVPTKVSVLESEQRDHGFQLDPVSQDVSSNLKVRRIGFDQIYGNYYDSIILIVCFQI